MREPVHQFVQSLRKHSVPSVTAGGGFIYRQSAGTVGQAANTAERAGQYMQTAQRAAQGGVSPQMAGAAQGLMSAAGIAAPAQAGKIAVGQIPANLLGGVSSAAGKVVSKNSAGRKIISMLLGIGSLGAALYSGRLIAIVPVGIAFLFTLIRSIKN